MKCVASEKQTDEKQTAENDRCEKRYNDGYYNGYRAGLKFMQMLEPMPKGDNRKKARWAIKELCRICGISGDYRLYQPKINHEIAAEEIKRSLERVSPDLLYEAIWFETNDGLFFVAIR